MAPLPSLHHTLQLQPHIGARQNAASPTTIPFPLSTTDPSDASPTQIVAPHSDSSNSGLVAGATIGAIFGFLVLVVIFYKCCIDNRSAIWVPPFHTSYDDYGSEFGSSRDSRTSRVRRRGGDGGWSRRGDGVRKPPRARVRHRNKSESESSDGSRRKSRRRRDRRVSGAAVANNNGLMGWYWASSGRPKGRYYDYDRQADVWAGGRGKSIDD